MLVTKLCGEDINNMLIANCSNHFFYISTILLILICFRKEYNLIVFNYGK